MKRKKETKAMSPEAAEYMENLWEVWQQWQCAKNMFEQAIDQIWSNLQYIIWKPEKSSLIIW